MPKVNIDGIQITNVVIIHLKVKVSGKSALTTVSMCERVAASKTKNLGVNVNMIIAEEKKWNTNGEAGIQMMKEEPSSLKFRVIKGKGQSTTVQIMRGGREGMAVRIRSGRKQDAKVQKMEEDG